MTSFLERFAQCTGFEWDVGNAEKSWKKHRVSREEAEEVFDNRPLLLVPDQEHSKAEERWEAAGTTDNGRRLTVVFTIRGDRIRVIMARPMSRRERRRYEEASEEG